MVIEDYFKSYKSYPILFIGTGFSLRYLEKSFSWKNLLKYIVKEYSDDEHFWDLHYEFSENGKTDYLRMASKINKEFEDDAINNRNGKFKHINDLFYEMSRNGYSASRFKIYLSEIFKHYSIRAEKIDELEQFKKACKNVNSIITTNYDTLLEDITSFNPLVGNDILLSNPYGAIYKIHGCVKSPNLIIIDKKDYDSFDKKYELIRAQLIAFFIAHPIIFIGYSVNDENIKKVLHTIFRYVEPNSELAKQIRERFLLIEYKAGSLNDEIQDHDIQLLADSTTIRINKLETDDYMRVYNALADIKLPVSALDIRKVQGVVRQISEGGDVKVMIVDDFDKMRNNDRVLAIGSSKTINYITSHREFIIKYFEILDNNNKNIIPLINKLSIQTSQYFPAFGFATLMPSDAKLVSLMAQQEEKIKQYISIINHHQTRASTIQEIFDDDNIPQSYKFHALSNAFYKDQIPLNEMEDYLRNKISELNKENKEINTDYRKLLCLYDIKKYKPIVNGAN